MNGVLLVTLLACGPGEADDPPPVFTDCIVREVIPEPLDEVERGALLEQVPRRLLLSESGLDGVTLPGEWRALVLALAPDWAVVPSRVVRRPTRDGASCGTTLRLQVSGAVEHEDGVHMADVGGWVELAPSAGGAGWTFVEIRIGGDGWGTRYVEPDSAAYERNRALGDQVVPVRAPEFPWDGRISGITWVLAGGPARGRVGMMASVHSEGLPPRVEWLPLLAAPWTAAGP